MSEDVDGVSDVDLVDALRAGDTDAGGVLYNRHFQMAVRLARRTAPHPDEAEEIASEAFSRVFTVIRNGGGPTEAFSLYLRSAVRNTSISQLRYRARIKTLDDIEKVVVDHIPDHADDGHDIDSDLSAAFDSLPERYRRVLHARVLEGKSNRESAHDLDILPTTEAMVYMRARRALKKSYLETDGGRIRAALAALRKRRPTH
ncbi:sigma-70 family RNA polymerase sigma factor [Leucobacter viscericola]|uniref:Sigma-70 family RNA polymerase sigma factor n=1 Tax=Leucobacter viscericola TaxID=2714935 RepID=A0A6G7XH76_9MICO|nr:sigma-70 family RNA polymerase sigma factor [Leucobacter viscericola]QIK63862.1 sigma-70 family RNA polymerase sigma factor [Leucobacter viscericola]